MVFTLTVENLGFFNISFIYQVEIRLRRRITLYKCTAWLTQEELNQISVLSNFLRKGGNAL